MENMCLLARFVFFEKKPPTVNFLLKE
jgi:hypothetical protein